MLDRGGINSLIRLIHTIVNEKFLHFSRGSGGTGTPPVPPETMKNHPLDPDAGPHTGTLPEDEVVFEGAGHPHSGGAGGKKVTAADVVNVPAGGIAATDVQSALNELDTEKASTSHKDTHKSGGGDAFATTDLLEAIVKRLQESGGPTTLVIAAVGDGQFLKRDGATIVGAAAPTHNLLDGSVHPDTAAQGVTRGSIIVGSAVPEWDELTIGAAARYLRSDGTDLAYAQIPASEVVNTPAGGIAATDVQAALNELDTEKFRVDCTIPFAGDPIPDGADTRSLGSAAAEWLNLYMGDAGAIYFRLDQSVKLYGSAADVLATDDSFYVVGNLAVGYTAPSASVAAYIRPQFGAMATANAILSDPRASGNITTFRALRLDMLVDGTYTVTTGQLLNIVDPAGAGAITTLYGIYMEPLTKGGTNYGAYFGSPVGIGTATPGVGGVGAGAILDVKDGNIRILHASDTLGAAGLHIGDAVNAYWNFRSAAAGGGFNFHLDRYFAGAWHSVLSIARASGIVFIGDSANAKMTVGLTIQQGANDNEILALKSSDVAHGVTTLAETDTYAFFAKGSPLIGGIGFTAICEPGTGNYYAMFLTPIAGAVHTTKSTTGLAPMIINPGLTNGTGAKAVTANGNLVVIRNYTTTRFIFDAEGSAHADVEWTTYQGHDDLALIADMELELMLRESEGQTSRRHALERAGIIGKDSWHMENGKPRAMVNWTKVSMLHHGAFIQVAAKLEMYERAFIELGIDPAMLTPN